MNSRDNVARTLKSWDKEYKKGFTSFMVLVLLRERSMYGYELKARLEDIAESISFQESGIYQILKRFKDAGFVTIEVQRSDKGPNRKYYSVVASGLELLATYTRSHIYPVHKEMTKLFAGPLAQIIKEAEQEKRRDV